MEPKHQALPPDTRRHPGWRLLLFLFLFLFSLLVIGGIASTFIQQISVASEAAMLAATTAVSTWLAMRFLERQPFLSIGLVMRRESPAEIGFGVGGGILLVGGVTLVEWGAGAIRFQASEVPLATALVHLPTVTVLLIVAAATEEVLFRGYPFQRLLEASNGFLAVAVSSVVFGLLHARNPHATDLSVVNTMLAGVMLALAYLRTRALWLPIGLHLSWNWTLLVLGYPVSGLEVARMPWEVLPLSDQVWLHGGAYGPEGGAVATVALTAGALYLGLGMRKSALPSGTGGLPSPPSDSH